MLVKRGNVTSCTNDMSFVETTMYEDNRHVVYDDYGLCIHKTGKEERKEKPLKQILDEKTTGCRNISYNLTRVKKTNHSSDY